MTFNFNNSKKMALSKRDKSNKGNWDNKIKNLCNKINKNKNYFTTSSCSGRIILIIDEEKKRPGLILFRTHNRITFNQLKNVINNIINRIDNVNKNNLKSKINKTITDKTLKNKTILFKQEPCILVVSCRNKESQWKLFSLAKNNGWKKSGILSLDKKLLIELSSTENISFPIINKEKLIVNDNFLKIVIKKANKNLNRGYKKIKRLGRLF